MSRIARIALSALPALSAIHAASAWAEQSSINLQAPVTQMAAEIYDLHTLMMIICVVIFVAVFGVMFWSVFHHRKDKGAKAAHWHENTTIELAWTIVPVLILVGMAYPATKTVIAMKDTSKPDITVKATGYQWKWGYDYINGEGEGIKFISNMSTPQEQITGEAEKGENYLLEVDNPMVVPVGKKVRMLLTADDVIHAWWMPAFGIKQDAIPGFIRDAWFRADKEGIFRGNCAELCGKNHGFMPIEVHVVSAEKYTAWVNEKQGAVKAAAADETREWTLDELLAKGEEVFKTNCAACHQASGQGMPPAFPALDGSAVVLGPADAQLDVVMHGREGTAMAAFEKQLSDADLASVITYTRNAWSNKTGDAIQPAQIAAARN